MIAAPQTKEKRWRPALSTVAASVLGLSTYLPSAFDVRYSEIAVPEYGGSDGRYYASETAVTVRAPKADLDAISESFVLRNASELRKFIADKPELVSLIVEAFTVAQRYFPDAPAVLDLLEDSESDRVGVEFSVQTTKAPKEAQLTL
jgi:hypothetical protein